MRPDGRPRLRTSPWGLVELLEPREVLPAGREHDGPLAAWLPPWRFPPVTLRWERAGVLLVPFVAGLATVARPTRLLELEPDLLSSSDRSLLRAHAHVEAPDGLGFRLIAD